MRLMHVLASDPITWVRGQLWVTGVKSLFFLTLFQFNMQSRDSYLNISFRLTLDRGIRN